LVLAGICGCRDGDVVIGCADIKLTAGMWQMPLRPAVRRPQDDAVDDARNAQHPPRRPHHQRVAVIRCNASDEQWRLTCHDNSWVGQLGNCSPATAKRETRPHARHYHARQPHRFDSTRRHINVVSSTDILDRLISHTIDERKLAERQACVVALTCDA